MNYRKKVLVEAVQLDTSGLHKTNLPDGVGGINSPGADNWNYQGCEFHVETLEGRLSIKNGDWVLCGINGEHWPVARDIFEATYELADEVTPAAAQAQDEALAATERIGSLLLLHARFHTRVGCPGDDECYVCELATRMVVHSDIATIRAALSSNPAAKEK